MFYFCKLSPSRLDARDAINYNRAYNMNGIFSGIENGRFKKIGFFGLGKSNLSLLSTLPLSECETVLRSEKEINRAHLPKDIGFSRIFSGESAFDGLDEELLICSPSVKRDRQEFSAPRARGMLFSSDAELFFERAGEGDVIAVTGSDGKSTTTTLAASIISKSRRTSLIGNVGVPMLESLSQHSEVYCAELSSFMLTYLRPKLKRAAITNITPNHLNWHSSFDEYINVKLSILENAKQAVLSADDDILFSYLKSHGAFAATSTRLGYGELKKLCKCKHYFTYEQNYLCKDGVPIVSSADLVRREEYNIKNLLCAMALADGYAEEEAVIKAAREFSGLAHRTELFLSHNGIDYVNSSIDTTPERTKNTLDALGKRVILILSGRGKGASYDVLRAPVSRYAECVVICGEDKEKMCAALSDLTPCKLAASFDEAVKMAVSLAHEGTTVILSPAATSYDSFKNFEERGKKFKSIVLNTIK